MKAVQIIKQLQATAGRIEKEQILKSAFMDGERTFFKFVKMALNPLETFGVKKVPLLEGEDDSSGFTPDDFDNLTSLLKSRKLSGHAARDAILRAAANCDTETWNLFYRPVLLKDISCGVERSTFNKCMEYCAGVDPVGREYLIPVFGVQLAKDGGDESQAKKICGKKLLDVKLDGCRFVSILNKENGTVTQWTRSGHQNENFPQLCRMLERILPELPCSMVLDGEVVSDTFQKLMTQARRKSNPDTSDAKLALFDIIPLKDFTAGSCPIDQEKRHDMLCELETSGLLQHVAGDSIYVVPKKEVDLDTDKGQEELHEYRQEAARLKFEGIMVKDPRAGYVGKRTDAWLKIKPTITVDLKIVAVEEGTKKLKGKMGALVCEGYHDGKHVVTKVGTGFSDENRAAIWADRDKMIGQIVEIETDDLTKSADKQTYGLRFPGFVRFRSAGLIAGEKD